MFSHSAERKNSTWVTNTFGFVPTYCGGCNTPQLLSRLSPIKNNKNIEQNKNIIMSNYNIYTNNDNNMKIQ
jgi:hypothetical protein